MKTTKKYCSIFIIIFHPKVMKNNFLKLFFIILKNYFSIFPVIVFSDPEKKNGREFKTPESSRTFFWQ